MAKEPQVKSASADAGLADVDLEAASDAGIKIPSDLSKVSNAKARELVDAGVVQDRDLPGKMYKRKADGFVARIPNYTWEGYGTDLQGEWDEIKLTSDPDAQPTA